MMSMPANDGSPTHRSALTPDQAEHRHTLNRELRAAFLAGAEERSHREQGRGPTVEELRAVLERYPGDLAES